ncbi:superoxide dismutase [Candidatus Nitronereus thalassa]|uniref:superoxide dismutase n=1 Tax=Candidatus Nitronereus thalassa TaxID=3020898 RepID=A0ABU3KBB4_9BACT|nr:Fe-Mn family superoxide dismutase [Candidatus Nitronereus thalassa]MDT7043714.1 Fe-Mn family superoxide dismutase [Candidatus Nitronereus thalassa]
MMLSADPYKAKEYNLSGLNGISDESLEKHFSLYEGYVKATNKLNDQLATFLQDGTIDQEEMPAYSELTRRLGFEYNGMILHEYYFGNLTRYETGDPAPSSVFLEAATASFGSYQLWKTHFTGVAKMRGVGWAVCYQNPANGMLSNHWITLHETGNVSGFIPVLVLDVWEHAYIWDYALADRPKYIDAFFSNIDWDTVEQRMKSNVSSLVEA